VDSVDSDILTQQVKAKVMLRPTVIRPVYLGVKHPSGAQDQICVTVRQLRVVDVRRPPWRRTGLSFTVAAGPRQHSHSHVWVQRDSWPYFTVSDSRLSQPGGPGPRIYIPQEQGGLVVPQALGSLLVASYGCQGYGGGIRTCLVI
jgi:hypothetical protein